jgi:hypothetical protein
MTTKRIWIIPLTALLGLMMFSCAAQNAAVSDEEAAKNAGPPLLPGQLVESVDAHTVRVMCTGVGDGTKGATVNARQGCLDWFVRTRLGLIQEDIAKYRGMREEIFANLDTFIEVPGPARMGGGGKGILSRTTMDANQVRIRCIVDLYKGKLKEHLSQSGLAAASTPVGGKSPVLAIQPGENTQKHPKRHIIQNLVAAYLVKNKFDVVEWKDSAEPAKGVVASGNAKATAAGVDVLIVFEAEKVIKGPALSYIITLKATEPSSGKTVGAATASSVGRSKISPTAEADAIQEATSDALAQLEPQLLAYSRKK